MTENKSQDLDTGEKTIWLYTLAIFLLFPDQHYKFCFRAGLTNKETEENMKESGEEGGLGAFFQPKTSFSTSGKTASGCPHSD